MARLLLLPGLACAGGIRDASGFISWCGLPLSFTPSFDEHSGSLNTRHLLRVPPRPLDGDEKAINNQGVSMLPASEE